MTSLGSVREQFLDATFARLDAAWAKANQLSAVFWACAFMLVASLLLGGGTRGGFLSDAILELLAVPALLLAIWSLLELPWASADGHRTHWVLAFCFAIAFVPLFQLVPLPPGIWTRLPGREAVVTVFDLLGGQRPWMPLSVEPNSTWLSALSLLPPMAIFLCAIQISYRERRALTLVVLAVGVVSAFVGLLQVAQGSASPLRFFTVTNDTEAVGFFANRNHFAALLYTVLLFAAAWAIDIAFKSGSLTNIRSLEPARILALTAALTVLVVLIASEAMARSRAGLALTIAGLAIIFVMASTDRRSASGMTPGKLLLGAAIFAVILALQFALYRFLDRFTVDPLEDARISFAHNTIGAALAFMPFGAGVGTFVPVYAMFERPIDTIANTYANHAHNDFLEMWLESGVMGMALLGLFITWMAFRTLKLWWKPVVDASELDCALGRAATMAIWLLVAHSFVDYPLRTGAMMAVFAFCCAMSIKPWASSKDPIKVKAERGQDKRARQTVEQSARDAVSSPSSTPAPVPLRETKILPPTPQRPAERWGEDIEWPEEWRSGAGDDQSKSKN